ncbi:MAG: peptidase M20 [Flavobacteriaceae bacterium CG_4_8_14_3_um_filter_34_10]|nr:M20/M25/M40 family metallo-hydrolase [Flavobacteriia bacterium]PIQ19011.1 MAG: peptidase M20 [Flavobacteriaceae bacterium CG18_big_fil_WC_8_21_14_2_50_34_36]PIV49399.1 MAG: peptidase M20 [Flavobacteriaceae bacterium CG02_land_8_20_14_3_00_34_13]PIX09204.1 MAG: peptidase M20 [Flavobacteriaceae bacterium CG_4_8_14_3_um_filter_34_10]PIZ08194.1 MAG: peptidase M20 [Flavobacteriaceae bacterium CG_4_10_14_0_8_um_filter_34_31]PJC08351.1 MAG: peptidase M20 [Flavobacteriaceae bacterium CG_4_9_14_0_8_
MKISISVLVLFSFFIKVQSQELPLQLDSETYSFPLNTESSIIKEELLSHIQFLASDKLEGRKTGQPGNLVARNYIYSYLETLHLDVTLQPFSFERKNKKIEASNIITVIEGTELPKNYMVITAHYDHVGIGKTVKNDSIYNGADDNASGVAALLVLAKYFQKNKPKNSLIFIALDAEEMGLQGAKYFVENRGDKNMVLNINMDMISRNENNEIYICGTRYTPSLKKYFSNIPENTFPITFTLGHDGLDGKDSWVKQSDHYYFYKNTIPFLYFGVEDHPDYHKPSDTFENIQPDFYFEVVQFIANTIADLDSKIK